MPKKHRYVEVTNERGESYLKAVPVRWPIAHAVVSAPVRWWRRLRFQLILWTLPTGRMRKPEEVPTRGVPIEPLALGSSRAPPCWSLTLEPADDDELPDDLVARIDGRGLRFSADRLLHWWLHHQLPAWTLAELSPHQRHCFSEHLILAGARSFHDDRSYRPARIGEESVELRFKYMGLEYAVARDPGDDDHVWVSLDGLLTRDGELSLIVVQLPVALLFDESAQRSELE